MQTRRGFIGSLTAALAVPSVGLALPTAKSDDWFQDLVVDRYYVLQGGPYGDTGGWGGTYSDMGAQLTKLLTWYNYCRELEDNCEILETKGYYLAQSQYFGKPFCQYEKIPLTKKWLTEFYRCHKVDKPEDWQKRYDDYYDALCASGWKASDDYQ